MINKKITYLSLALILLVVFVQESIARTIPQSNANPLLKRGEDNSVCVIARAVFDDEVTGIITLAEKEEEDCDGNIVANLTDSIEFVDGGTKPFFTKIDLDLDDLVGSGSGDKRKRQANNPTTNNLNTNSDGTVPGNAKSAVTNGSGTVLAEANIAAAR
ncbi:hypothetical protein F8M41_011751 [Gigaspora margarita]|uniref:Uncharacterized protein n=1 Tax=Gigaspora margarita TaxID=4874 RepID=A0A8H4EUV3_GIGMA|nr:hypothetical protein F8M41_011751 [Gigaspora margarita]